MAVLLMLRWLMYRLYRAGALVAPLRPLLAAGEDRRLSIMHRRLVCPDSERAIKRPLPRSNRVWRLPPGVRSIRRFSLNLLARVVRAPTPASRE